MREKDEVSRHKLAFIEWINNPVEWHPGDGDKADDEASDDDELTTIKKRKATNSSKKVEKHKKIRYSLVFRVILAVLLQFFVCVVKN